MWKEERGRKQLSSSLLIAATMVTAVAASTIASGLGEPEVWERFVSATLFAIAAGLGIMTLAKVALVKEVRLYRLSMMVAVTLFVAASMWFLATALVAQTS